MPTKAKEPETQGFGRITIGKKSFPLVLPGDFTYRESMRAEELADLSIAEIMASFDRKKFSVRCVYACLEISASRVGFSIPETLLDENWTELLATFTGALPDQEEPPADPKDTGSGSSDDDGKSGPTTET